MKKHTLELTTEERDMLRDFFMSYFGEYADGEKDPVAKKLYTKVDRLDMDEVNAS